MRALVVTNMYPTPERPALGSFVRDQVEALRRRGDVEVELFTFRPGLADYPRAARELRRRYGRTRFDVVHAHFGLTAWPAVAARLGPVVVTLHGNDLFHPRSNRLTRAILPLTTLPAAVSREFSGLLPGAGTTRRVAVLPVGIDLERFRADPAREARERLGLDPGGRYLLFPHDPSRPLKRFDRAREAAGGTTLLTMGRVPPAEVPFWINAANAVLVPSQAEGFGLSVIEALACGVPAVRDAGRDPSGRARRDRRRVLRAVGRDGLESGAAARARGRGPARRRPGARRAVLGRPDGRARRRGVARRGRRALTRTLGRLRG